MRQTAQGIASQTVLKLVITVWFANHRKCFEKQDEFSLWFAQVKAKFAPGLFLKSFWLLQTTLNPRCKEKNCEKIGWLFGDTAVINPRRLWII
jgi:hypothetical protein